MFDNPRKSAEEREEGTIGKKHPKSKKQEAVEELLAQTPIASCWREVVERLKAFWGYDDNREEAVAHIHAHARAWALDARLAELRTLLQQSPSYSSWEQLLGFLELWPDDGGLQTALAYTQEHVEDWPARLRQARRISPSHPGWALVTKAQVYPGRRWVAQMPRLTQMRDLHIANPIWTDLSGIYGVEHLHTLSLSNVYLDQVGAIVQNTPSLRHLRLFSGIRKAPLSLCAGMKQLETLTLDGFAVKGEELLPTFTGLQHLKLHRFNGTLDISALKPLSELRTLLIWDRSEAPAHIEHIDTALPQLEAFGCGISVFQRHHRALARMPALETLQLSGDLPDLRTQLAPFSRLKALKFIGRRVSNEIFYALLGLPALEKAEFDFEYNGAYISFLSNFVEYIEYDHGAHFDVSGQELEDFRQFLRDNPLPQ